MCATVPSPLRRSAGREGKGNMARRNAVIVGTAAMLLATAAAAYEDDELAPDGLAGKQPKRGASLTSRGLRSRLGPGHSISGSQLLATLLNRNGHFRADGVDG